MLQADWSICRLRPNGVSTGTMATQFDCTPQSPQPSHTRSLMKTRLLGSGKCAALAPPPLLGRTGLVVDDDAGARHLHEFLLHRLQIVAVMEGHMRREAGIGWIFVGLVGDDRDALDAFGAHLMGDHRHAELAVMRLAAGHGDGVVVEDLVGDVDAATPIAARMASRPE